MDDFSILTIREPWLIKRISTSNASAWLAGGKLMPQGRRGLRRETKSTETSKRPLWRKGRLTKESHNFLYKRWLCADLQNNLAHTSTYFVNLGFWQLIVFKVWKFSKLMRWTCLRRHYAHARAVRFSRCTLEWLGYCWRWISVNLEYLLYIGFDYDLQLTRH
jgi:hypothetical protein